MSHLFNSRSEKRSQSCHNARFLSSPRWSKEEQVWDLPALCLHGRTLNMYHIYVLGGRLIAINTKCTARGQLNVLTRDSSRVDSSL